MVLKLRTLDVHVGHPEKERCLADGRHPELVREADGCGRADLDAEAAEAAAVELPVELRGPHRLRPVRPRPLDRKTVRRTDPLAGLAGDAQRLAGLVAVEAE